MEAIIAKQTAIQNLISSHYDNFRKKGQNRMTCELARTRMDRLKALWSEFLSNDEMIRESPDVEYGHAYFTDDHIYTTQESMDDTMDLYVQFLKTNAPPQEQAPAPPQPPAQQAANSDGIQNLASMLRSLPQLTLPEFSGNASDWPHFRDLFISLVHKQPYPAIVKFNYLHKLLKGEALEVIKSVAVADDNYEAAWDQLKLFYENERRLIHNHLSDLYAVKPMTTDSYAEVKRVLRETFAPLDALTALKRPTKYWSDMITFMLVENMDKNTRRDWEKHLGRTSQPPSFERAKSFLEAQALIYESVERASKSSGSSGSSSRRASVSTSLQTSVDSTSKKNKEKKDKPQSNCPLCSGEHSLSKCTKFQQKSLSERKSLVLKLKRCFNCLGSHQMSACKSKLKCFTCQGKHHTLLHYSKENADSSIIPSLLKIETSSATEPVVQNTQAQGLNPSAMAFNGATLNFGQKTGVVLATARILVEGPGGRKIKARALIDNCSQPSFISRDLFSKLQLPGTPTNTQVSSVGGVQVVTGTEGTEFKIRPHFNSRFSCKVNALVVPCVCDYSPPQTQAVSNLLYLANLNLADPTFLDDTKIDVLLGAEVHAIIIQESIVRGKPNEPIATSSLLGWLISGAIPVHSHVSTLASFHCAQNENLSEIVQRFWFQEELPSAKRFTPEERECEEHFCESFKRDGDGRYVVRLPFKSPVTAPLGDSYRKAVAMLKRMEEKFSNNPEFKQLYTDFMEDYITRGHMIPITSDSPLFKPESDCYFLPHHGVMKPTSSTTKLRTVFNASSKTDSNVSLNDLLYTGPNLLPELPKLVSAWRLYQYVFVADIKQMFRQIRLHDEDQHYQAVVWRSNPGEPIQTYYLTTVTYGLVSSPYQATRTLRQLASDYHGDFPMATEVLEKECYMDDMLSGGHTLNQTLEKQNQLINLLKEGGFELRKWLANEPKVLEHLPQDHLAVDTTSIFEDSSSFPILGLKWQAKNDSFTFEVEHPTISGEITKRSVLSKIAKIFDPMGWIAPVTVSAKIFMQSLWLLKCGWDDPLPPEYVHEWETWASKLTSLNSVAIPRFVGYSQTTITCELHGFSDASQKACSAVIYLRLISEESIRCSLQVAKTKVAPLKTLSIPRLELVGAFMLSELTSHFISSLPVKMDSIHMWSDSKDVLFWLRRHPSQWQTFVANRCSAILTALPTANWHYVRSADNPADVASRGLEPDLLSDHPLWWRGPSWLRDNTRPWPTTPDELLDHKPIEQRVEKLGLLSGACAVSPENQMWDLGTRFSSMSRLVRVSAYVLRFVYRWFLRYGVDISPKLFKFLDFSCMNSICLSVQELRNARLLWIYHTQQAYFATEIKSLESSRGHLRVKLEGALRKLNPSYENSFLRVGGRLDQSLLPYDQKHPFILPSDSFLSQLLVHQAHRKTLHGGVQMTLSTLRQEYWIIKGRQLVKRVIGECNVCIRFSNRHPNQLMGDLPRLRVTPSAPFSHSGVDYAGPFSIRLTKTRGRGTLKAFVCLFVCLATRGIHLELVEDYTSESFIAAFHRFTSIWGHCKELVSDRGTNFVGADSELRLLFRQSSTFLKEIHLHLAQQGTRWTWNPPAAPHFGGIWEAGVKSTKHHIRRVVGESILTFSEMETLLRRIQACLNSRPLLPLSDEISDNNFLTPAHFLIHRESYLIPEPDYTNVHVSAGHRWQLISQKVQHFWKRWRNEYLSALQPRQKWNKETRSFQLGDIVFIRQENTPPGHWPLARVVNTFPDKHGVNRICEVRTAKSSFRRPTVKLILLLPVEKLPSLTIRSEVPSSHLVLLQSAT